MRQERNKLQKLKGVVAIIFVCLLWSMVCSGCGQKKQQELSASKTEKLQEKEAGEVIRQPLWNTLEKTGEMEISYATQFQVDYLGEYAHIWIGSEQYLLVPENQEIPIGLPEEIVVLKQPLNNLYLVSTSCMDFYRVLDGMRNIGFSGLKEGDWYIEEAKKAMQRGEIRYAGKYSMPDYELLLSGDCKLAIENTMILHNPEVKEQLERLGISVLIERSSYENNPLGRMEWVKLHGLLLGKEKQAEDYFAEQMGCLEELQLQKMEKRPTVAFFYVHSNGTVNVRKGDDYVACMLTMAGGDYIFSHMIDQTNAMSSVNLQMEEFYHQAKDADYLIYNSTIDGEMDCIDQLLDKSELFADFKAVKENQVYCVEKNMFQQTTGMGDMIKDFYHIFLNEQLDSLVYMHQLQP